mmetsp:Transcript_42457/g.48788  ORF Transcript_42457/g.48788 Transcript_42457/m.48788 type:complete len:190 (+) Transcript_42457:25-594(+)
MEAPKITKELEATRTEKFIGRVLYEYERSAVRAWIITACLLIPPCLILNWLFCTLIVWLLSLWLMLSNSLRNKLKKAKTIEEAQKSIDGKQTEKKVGILGGLVFYAAGWVVIMSGLRPLHVALLANVCFYAFNSFCWQALSLILFLRIYHRRCNVGTAKLEYLFALRAKKLSSLNTISPSLKREIGTYL